MSYIDILHILIGIGIGILLSLIVSILIDITDNPALWLILGISYFVSYLIIIYFLKE